MDEQSAGSHMMMIIAAMTNPRITMVSGIASRIMMIPVSSGRSAIVPAPAVPILDCAHAVDNAPIPIESAAPNACSNVTIYKTNLNISNIYIKFIDIAFSPSISLF
jgi:hypothetical protein